MSESDLDDALNDLDFPDADEDSGGDDLASLAADLGVDDAGGGDDLASLADDFGGGDSGGGDDLASLADDFGGGDSGGDDDMLPAMDSSESDAALATALTQSIPGVSEDTANIEFLLDLKLHMTFEVGRSKMLISDLLTLGQGSVIELHRLVGDELDLLVNGKLVAKGEVVVVNEKFGCRITTIVPPEDRIKHLAGY